MVTEHLIAAGGQRPAFLGHLASASTVDARIAGFRDAAVAHLRSPERVVLCKTADAGTVHEFLERLDPDSIVCANDATAAELMFTLDSMGVDVPDQIRVAGIDDVRYASHLRVPLTTLQQPCEEIGETAVSVMLSRIEQPNLPARDVLLECKLVVRQSCGSSKVPAA